MRRPRVDQPDGPLDRDFSQGDRFAEQAERYYAGKEPPLEVARMAARLGIQAAWADAIAIVEREASVLEGLSGETVDKDQSELLAGRARTARVIADLLKTRGKR